MKIVVAFDGSAGAKDALGRLSWFRREELEVVVVAVVGNGPALDEKGDGVDADPAEVARVRRAVDGVVSDLKECGMRAEVRVLAGDPARLIVDAAAAEGADLVITGCRGLGWTKRLVFGSVSSAVLNDAPCPVLVVR